MQIDVDDMTRRDERWRNLRFVVVMSLVAVLVVISYVLMAWGAIKLIGLTIRLLG